MERGFERKGSKPSFIITAQELIDNDITEIPWLWDKLIPYRCLTFVSGDSDVGKSTLLRQLSLAIVAGEEEYLGQRLRVKHKSVIYVSTEDDIISMSPKLKVEKDYFSSTGGYTNLRYIFDEENISNKLKEALSLNPADLIILDAFGDLFDGDINSQSETRSFMKEFKSFAGEYSCSVVFLHHNRKAAAKGKPDKHDLLGSMAIEAKGRSVLMLSQSNSRTDRRTLMVVKGNYLTPAEKEVVYSLSFGDGIFELNESPSYISPSSEDEEITKIVFALNEKGLSIRDIAEAMRAQGHEISKSTVYRILKK